MIATVPISSFGVGLTLPFTLILLHEVRGISLPTVGLLLAVPGVVGVAAVAVSGVLMDRLGPRTVLRLALTILMVGNVLLAYATSPRTALPALALIGLGMGPTFPATSALLNGLVEGQGQVQRAFGIQFTAQNAGFGLGGLVGAAVVDVGRPGTFEVLYVACAMTCAAQALLLPGAPAPVHAHDTSAPSYRDVLSDRAFRRVCLVSLLFALTGHAALESGMPAFARVVAHVSPSVIALVFAVNTAVIVGGQLVVLRVLKGRRRSSALALAAGVWALSWAILGLVPGLGQGARVLAVLVFGGVFAVGETFMAPSLQPLVNALATDRSRGRYNAVSGACFSSAFVVTPAVSGVLIGNGLGVVWLVGIVLGCLVSAAVALRLQRRLTDEQDGCEVVPLHPLDTVGV
ncbi:MAG: transporter [Frankiales bacterium]|nr:transporter [Frankiales bacterium]